MKHDEKQMIEKTEQYFRGVREGKQGAILQLYWFIKGESEFDTVDKFFKFLIKDKNDLVLGFKLTTKQCNEIKQIIKMLKENYNVQ